MFMDTVDERLVALAKRQDGVFSLKDAEAAGADNQLRFRRVRSGEWERVGAAGYKHKAAALTWRGRCRAAVWDAGINALVSHDAAAQAYRFPGFTSNEVHILVPKSLDHVCTIATVHESRRFELVTQRLMWEIPMTAPAETLVHLAPDLSVKRLAWLTDELLLGKKVDLRRLDGAFARLAPSCRGMSGLRAVLHDHAPGEPVPESKLERAFMEFAAKYRLPPMMRQVNLPGRGQWPGRVDFFWPDLRLVVETDGLRYHRTPAQQAKVRRRDQLHTAAGRTPLRFTHAQIRFEPSYVERILADVAEVLRPPR